MDSPNAQRSQDCEQCGAPLALRVSEANIRCLYCNADNALDAATQAEAAAIAAERKRTDRLSRLAEASRARLEKSSIVRSLLDQRALLLSTVLMIGAGGVGVMAATEDLHGSALELVPSLLFALGFLASATVLARSYRAARERALNALRAVPLRTTEGVIPGCRCCGSALGERTRGLVKCAHCACLSLLDDVVFRANESAAQGEFERARQIQNATATLLDVDLTPRISVLAGAAIAWGLAAGALSLGVATLGLVTLEVEFSTSPWTMFGLSAAAGAAAVMLTRTLHWPFEGAGSAMGRHQNRTGPR